MDQLWNGKKRKITIKERGTGVLKRQLVADDARDDGIFNHFVVLLRMNCRAGGVTGMDNTLLCDLFG